MIPHASCNPPFPTPTPFQVKYVAAPPKPKDMTSMMSKGLFVDYSVLCKASYTMYE